MAFGGLRATDSRRRFSGRFYLDVTQQEATERVRYYKESEVKTKSDRLESDARTRAAMLDSETEARRKEIFGNLEKEKEALNNEIESLRSFEREYRSRLKSYFTQQLEALDGNTSSAATLPTTQSDHAPKRLRSILGEEPGDN